MFSDLKPSEASVSRDFLTLAHQYLHQLEPEIHHAVLGSAGTLIALRVGAEDAPYVAREFLGVVEERDLQTLENHHMYVRLLIDGQPSKPFSALCDGPNRSP